MAALADLDQEPGQWWLRQGGLPGNALSYELRPGGNRPGPEELWMRFDQIVDEIGAAMQSHSVPGERAGLERLSLVLHEIAEALVDDGLYERPRRAGKRGEEAEEGVDERVD